MAARAVCFISRTFSASLFRLCIHVFHALLSTGQAIRHKEASGEDLQEQTITAIPFVLLFFLVHAVLIFVASACIQLLRAAVIQPGMSASTICCSPRSRPAFSSCMDLSPRGSHSSWHTSVHLIRVLSSFSLWREGLRVEASLLVERAEGSREDLVVAATTGVFSLALPSSPLACFFPQRLFLFSLPSLRP